MARSIKATLELDTKQAEKGVSKVGSALKALATGAALKEVAGLSDQFTSLTNRLKSVTGSTDEAASAFALVKQVAGDTRSGLSDVANLFTDITIATAEMGLSQEQVARTASTFSKALKISGADANATSGAIRQFGQALASGVLRGDEFNSIMEANPTFMRKVAGTLDVTTGQLRKMAEQGLLTSDVMVAATAEISDSIDEDFGKTMATIGESFVALKDALMETLGRIEENTGVFSGFAETIKHVADNIDTYIKLAALAFGAMAVKNVMNMVKAIKALQLATKAQAIAQAALLALSGPAGWGMLAGAAIATGGAVAGLNALLDETTDKTKEATEGMGDIDGETSSSLDSLRKVTTELQAQVDLNKDGILQAKEEVALSVLKQKIAKDLKTQEDEAARILERQTEEFKAQLDELKSNSAEYRDQLELALDLADATDSQRTRLQDIADIETDRKNTLQDLYDLTALNDAERLKREQEINDEFDERLRLSRLNNKELTNIRIDRERVDLANGLVRSSAEYLQILQTIKLLNTSRTSQEKRGHLELMDMYAQQEDARRELREEFNLPIHGIGEAYSEAVANLTQEERDEFQTRQDNLEQFLTISLAEYKAFAEKRNQIEDDFNAKFVNGFRAAFDEFKETVENNAEFGRRVFDNLTSSWEDAFVKFAETGKLSFKDLFKTLMTEIIKMAANRLFLALFDPTGGLFSSLFAGFFANGGNIPSGKFGVVGESGPEIVTGPASVMSASDSARALGGGQTIVYNISAVDTQSFQSALARDPEYIYSLTRAGARRLPG